jgi:predicted nuclease with RNAse H fold
MLLIGLDAASDRRGFGYAIGSFECEAIAIDRSGVLVSRSDDGMAQISDALRRTRAGLIAIDAPLGWPSNLADSLVAHRAGERVMSAKHDMFRRATDRRLREAVHGGHQPLEVGADRIARATHEALTVLAELRDRSGLELPMVWDPAFSGVGVIEVYPAATLRAHGMPSRGYKLREQREAREQIASACGDLMPALSARCGRSADEFDACLCLLAAADFLQGRCAPPPAELRAVACREGWIWVLQPG